MQGGFRAWDFGLRGLGLGILGLGFGAWDFGLRVFGFCKLALFVAILSSCDGSPFGSEEMEASFPYDISLLLQLSHNPTLARKASIYPQLLLFMFMVIGVAGAGLFCLDTKSVLLLFKTRQFDFVRALLHTQPKHYWNPREP